MFICILIYNICSSKGQGFTSLLSFHYFEPDDHYFLITKKAGVDLPVIWIVQQIEM